MPVTYRWGTSGRNLKADNDVLPASHSHPIPYTRVLTGSTLRARNQRDVKQNVTRSFVNAGRLLRSLVDPGVKLTWKRPDNCRPEKRDDVRLLYWKPSLHQMRKRARETSGNPRHFGEYREALAQPLDEKQLEMRRREYAFSVAEAVLGLRGGGTSQRGQRKAELEMHAQAVIETYEGLARDELIKRQETRLIELQRGYVVKEKNKPDRIVAAELVEEETKARKSLVEIQRDMTQLDANLPKARATIEKLEPQKSQALQDKAELQTQLQEALEVKAAVNAKLKAALKAALLPKLDEDEAKALTTLLNEQWDAVPASLQEMAKPQAEQNAVKVAQQVETLKKKQQKLLKERPEALSADAQQLAGLESEMKMAETRVGEVELKMREPEDKLNELALAMELVKGARAGRAKLEKRLAQARQHLDEIAVEKKMKTSFVSLHAIDRMECLGSAHFDVLAAIGQRWIDNGLAGEAFSPSPQPSEQGAAQDESFQDSSDLLEQSDEDLQIHRFEPLDAGKLE